MAEGVTGNDDEASAGQFHHVHVLHFKVVLTAVLYYDQRQLVFGAGLLGNIDLSIQFRTVRDHKVQCADVYTPSVRLHEAGAQHTDQDHQKRHNEP